MRRAHESAPVQPPIWLPLGAGGLLAGLLAVLALPLYGYGAATWSRTVFLSTLLLWIVTDRPNGATDDRRNGATCGWL